MAAIANNTKCIVGAAFNSRIGGKLLDIYANYENLISSNLLPVSSVTCTFRSSATQPESLISVFLQPAWQKGHSVLFVFCQQIITHKQFCLGVQGPYLIPESKVFFVPVATKLRKGDIGLPFVRQSVRTYVHTPRITLEGFSLQRTCFRFLTPFVIGNKHAYLFLVNWYSLWSLHYKTCPLAI